MRSLFGRQKQRCWCPKFYLIIRFWWVQKMERLVFGLSKLQLCFYLILFTFLGTCLCFYMALKGFLSFTSNRMRIDEVTSIRPVYKDYNTGSLLINTSIKKDQKQSDLSRYIDSVLKVPAAVDLLQKDNFKGLGIWSDPATGNNNTANDKK